MTERLKSELKKRWGRLPAEQRDRFRAQLRSRTLTDNCAYDVGRNKLGRVLMTGVEHVDVDSGAGCLQH